MHMNFLMDTVVMSKAPLVGEIDSYLRYISIQPTFGQAQIGPM